jgi:excisionase family DNA binding protein
MPETKATPTLLTAREVQARLRVGRNAVYELARKREITTIKIGTKIFFPQDEVELVHLEGVIEFSDWDFHGCKTVLLI